MRLRFVAALLLSASLPFAVSAPLCAQAVASAPTLIPEEALPADPRFSADRVKADVTFLADDLLEGRDTGSRGHEIAARFVAQRFAALGLTPLGDRKDGKADWLQQITFQKTERVDAPAGITVSGPVGSATFAQAVDSLVGLSATEPKLDVSAPLVFVGYGLSNARLKLDDYAGLDVKGKIVVMLRGFPEGLPSETAAYLVNSKYEIAQAHGAIGVIQVDTNQSAKQRPWARRIALGLQPAFTWVGPDGKPFDETPGIRAAGGLGDKGATALFAGAPRLLAQIRKEADRKGFRPKGFALRTSARLFGESKSSRVTSPNVVAMIPGSDPALAGEYVVLSGHLDHIGISPAKPGDPVGKDRINNGAMDNAAGVATLMEVAHVLSQDKVKSRRSVIFLASTGEEKGLLGADYFARHPAVPIGKIVGNVDLDMPVLTYAFNDVTAYGADHSTLGKLTAIVDFAPAEARASADAVDARRKQGFDGPILGVPYTVKDTTWVQGRRVTNGSLLYKDFKPPRDAVAVERLKNAGGIFLGMTNTPEMAAKGHTENKVYGPTRHPSNTALTPGGSSGGAAAAVSALLVVGAI